MGRGVVLSQLNLNNDVPKRLGRPFKRFKCISHKSKTYRVKQGPGYRRKAKKAL